MIKRYLSKTEISLSVCLSGGGHAHVRFNPTSDGGSEYTTNNVAIQQGLEAHPKFGKLFTVLAEQPVEEKPKKKEVAPAEEAKNVIKVNSLQDAKDYLVETFGISRTQLTSKAKIIANAKANNVEFDGLN